MVGHPEHGRSSVSSIYLAADWRHGLDVGDSGKKCRLAADRSLCTIGAGNIHSLVLPDVNLLARRLDRICCRFSRNDRVAWTNAKTVDRSARMFWPDASLSAFGSQTRRQLCRSRRRSVDCQPPQALDRRFSNDGRSSAVRGRERINLEGSLSAIIKLSGIRLKIPAVSDYLTFGAEHGLIRWEYRWACFSLRVASLSGGAAQQEHTPIELSLGPDFHHGRIGVFHFMVC